MSSPAVHHDLVSGALVPAEHRASHALVPAGDRLPARGEVPVVGEARGWARDFAVVGGLSGILAPALVPLGMPAFAVAAGLMGAATGAAVGALLALVLERVRGRLPLLVIAACVLPLGALWGASAGVAGAVAGGVKLLVVPAALTAGIAGAFQLLWLWLPYTMCAVLRRPTWPVVLTAGVVAPLLGWAVLVALLMVL